MGESYGHNVGVSVSSSTKTASQQRCEPFHNYIGRLLKGGVQRSFALVAALLCLWNGTAVGAATLEAAEERQAAAESSQAALLSPTEYLRGSRALEKSRASQNDEKRARAADDAIEAFNQAISNAESAKMQFADTLARRQAAKEAAAIRLAPTDWARAEELLNEAVRALEREKIEKAQTRGGQASELYRQAWVDAVQTTQLGAARRAIADAEEARAGKFAPSSLASAKAQLAKAESVLERDPTATERAARMAGDAAYQARVAVFIAGQAQQVKDNETTVEDLLLAGQAPLQRLADTAGTSSDLSGGSKQVERELTAEIQRLQSLEAELEERRRQVAGLEEEIRELDQRLGNTSAERRNLMRVVQANLREREQYEQVRKLFSEQEAEVLREGDNVTIRMVGLTFPSGSSRLDDSGRGLIDRLQEALEIYPRSQVRVEGHTDSSGSPGANQSLSQKRATAVASYLIESAGLQAFRVNAMGYGDTRPVTSNRTAAGRAQNRRIDVVIITKPPDTF
jgi:outer membrane protein OmpA-like peptidoglycan-associated protein